MNPHAMPEELTATLIVVGVVAVVMIVGFAVLMVRAFWRARDYVGPDE